MDLLSGVVIGTRCSRAADQGFELAQCSVTEIKMLNVLQTSLREEATNGSTIRIFWKYMFASKIAKPHKHKEVSIQECLVCRITQFPSPSDVTAYLHVS